MRESIHGKVRVPENAKAIEYGRRAGYKTGGAVADGVHKHEKHLHKGEPETPLKKGGRIKRKKGGSVAGKKSVPRLDKRARKAEGGAMTDEQRAGAVDALSKMPEDQNKAAMGTLGRLTGRKIAGQPGVGSFSNRGMGFKKGGAPEKRDRGGAMDDDVKPRPVSEVTPRKVAPAEKVSMRPVKEVKPAPVAEGRARGGRAPKTNIIINTTPPQGGAGGADPQALQQAKQEGAKMGAMAVIQKLKGAGGPGGPPGAPPGAPPMGGPPPGMGAPPPGGMPPMHAKGGKVESAPETVKVKGHVRRRAGGKIGC